MHGGGGPQKRLSTSHVPALYTGVGLGDHLLSPDLQRTQASNGTNVQWNFHEEGDASLKQFTDAHGSGGRHKHGDVRKHTSRSPGTGVTYGNLDDNEVT